MKICNQAMKVSCRKPEIPAKIANPAFGLKKELNRVQSEACGKGLSLLLFLNRPFWRSRVSFASRLRWYSRGVGLCLWS